MQKTEAYKRYLEAQKKTGRIPYFDDEEFEDIVLDLEEDFRLREAKEALAWGLKYHPDSEELDKLRILLMIDGGEYDAAERLLARYQGDGTRRTLDLAFTLAQKRRLYEKAYQVYIDGVKSGILSVEDACDGLDNVWDAFPREALSEAVVALMPFAKGDAIGLRKLGVLHMNLDELEEAIIAFDAALDLDAYDVDSWRCLAKCYLDRKEYEKCRDACHYGLAVDDGDISLHYMRGYAYCKLGDSDNAILDLNRVCEFREGGAQASFQNDLSYDDQIQQMISVYEMLAQCYQKKESIDDAIDCWIRLATLDSANSNVYFHLAALHAAKGDLPAADRWIVEALMREPKKQHYIALQVSILTAMRRYPEAASSLEYLITLNPNNKDYLLAAANLYVNLKDWDKADTYFLRLLQTKPKEKRFVDSLVSYFESTGRGDMVKDLQ